MSRRRGPRERRQDSGSDHNQRVLQVALVAAGILFLLIGVIITVGIPVLPGLSSSGDDGGSESGAGASQTTDTSSSPAEATTTVPDTEESSSSSSPTPTSTATETSTPTPTPTPTATETATPTPTPSPTPTPAPTQTSTSISSSVSGNLQIINKVDENGNGYVSDFDVEIQANTQIQSGQPYFVVKINGQTIGETGTLKRTKNGVFTIGLPPSTFESYQRGQLRVTVTLIAKTPGPDRTIKSWTKTVNYEPE